MEGHDFLLVRIDELERGEACPCDLFIKLSEKKVIKLFSEGDMLSSDRIDQYVKKNVEHFLVRKDEFYQNLEKLSPKNFDKSLFEKKDERIVPEDFRETLESVGVKKELLSNACDEFEKIIEDNSEDMSEIISLLKLNKGNYLFKHSFLLMVIIKGAISKFEWRNKEIYEGLVDASLYHDMGYSNPQRALMEDVSKERFKTLEKSIQEDLLNHSEKIMNILLKRRKTNRVMLDAIRDHSYSPDGFNQNVNITLISKPTALFILVHDFVDKIYKSAFNQDKYLENLEGTIERFSAPVFKKIHESFRDGIVDVMQISLERK